MPKKEDDNLIDMFRKCQLRATGQRLAIMKTLLESQSHLSADELYQQLKVSHPTLSLSTVYKTLQVMAEMGAISTVETGPGSQKFDGKTYPHHHAICSQCGQIFDVEFEKYPIELKTINIVPDFTVQKVKVYFNGICVNCDKENKENKERNAESREGNKQG